MTVMRAAKVAVLGVAALALGSCSVVGGGGGWAGGPRFRFAAHADTWWATRRPHDTASTAMW
uniref:hypothetical protein n=1 Tax=Nocardia wallacei TaxID=480035 RepID=UPI0024587248